MILFCLVDCFLVMGMVCVNVRRMLYVMSMVSSVVFFWDMNGSGIFIIGKMLMMILMFMIVWLMIYMVMLLVVMWMKGFGVFWMMWNVLIVKKVKRVSIMMYLIRLSFLLMIVKMKLLFVVGSYLYFFCEFLSLSLKILLEVMF